MNTSLLTRVWALPLTRMLLLSCGVHLALIMVVRPRAFPAVDQTVVIRARLEKEVVATVVAEAGAAPAAEPPAVAVPAPVVVAPPAEPPVSAPPQPQAAAEPAPAPRPAVTETPPAEPAAKVEAPAAPARGSEPAAPSLPSIPVMIDTTWYEARQLDVSPKALRPIKPTYPAEAIRQGIEGTVKLMLRVDEYGVVREAEVVEGSPPGVFDESALDAFRNARFEAARRDRLPVRALIYIRVHYELND
jgi:protein TonB